MHTSQQRSWLSQCAVPKSGRTRNELGRGNTTLHGTVPSYTSSHLWLDSPSNRGTGAAPTVSKWTRPSTVKHIVLGFPLAALLFVYTYDSFGKLTASAGSLTNPFQYTGRESDPETGLYYYRARYYDPGVDRFMSEDPIGFGGGINAYAYVRNNAANFTDPRGLQSGCPAWVPNWLCYLLGREPSPKPSPVQTCFCTRTIVKPQPFTPNGPSFCTYQCDCSPGRTFVTSFAPMRTLKGCKDIKNCPHQVFGDVDPSKNTFVPNPSYPVNKEPLSLD